MSEQKSKGKLSKKLKMLLDVTFWKFLLVGVANTLVGYGISAFFLNVIGLTDAYSSAIGFVFGGALSYTLNRVFTFNKKGKDFSDIWKFILVLAVCWTISYIGAKSFATWVLKDVKEIVRDNLVLIFTNGIYLVLNYLGQRFFVFVKKTNEQEKSQEKDVENYKKEDEKNN